MLDIIGYPVSAVLWFWHKLLSFVLSPDSGVTWVLAVALLVVTFRSLLLKPFVAQIKSMRTMQKVAPEMKKIQEKYKNDRTKMTEEMQKLQSEHGFNPLMGCLPLLIQLPVFFGLYRVLRDFTPGAESNFFFDSAGVKSFIDAKFLGAPLSEHLLNSPVSGGSFFSLRTEELARFGAEPLTVGLVTIPLMLIAGVLTHITARHSVTRQQSMATGSNPQQAAIMNKLAMYVFPLFVVVGGPFFPFAIIVYWISNNGWTLGQQYFVYKSLDAKEAAKAAEVAETVEERGSLAPKPGQKPAQPKNKRPAAGGSGANGQASGGKPSTGSQPKSGAQAKSGSQPKSGSQAKSGSPSKSGQSGKGAGGQAGVASPATGNGSSGTSAASAKASATGAGPTSSRSASSGAGSGGSKKKRRNR